MGVSLLHGTRRVTVPAMRRPGRGSFFGSRGDSRAAIVLLALLVVLLFCAEAALAHGMSGRNQSFVATASGVHPMPFVYLGAAHMVTGYDHLLYLAGVVFYLTSTREIVKFVSLFALGHSITLLSGVLSGLRIDEHIVDAIIGLSVCYKALENLGSFRFLEPRAAVFGFGLIHGLGLASRFQDIELSADGLLANMIFFNVGVEIGQILALTCLVFALGLLRATAGFRSFSYGANLVLFSAGLVLFGRQITAVLLT